MQFVLEFVESVQCTQIIYNQRELSQTIKFRIYRLNNIYLLMRSLIVSILKISNFTDLTVVYDNTITKAALEFKLFYAPNNNYRPLLY